MRDLPFTVRRLAMLLVFIAVAAIAPTSSITRAELPSRPEIASPESVGLSSVELGRITSLLRDCVSDGKISGAVALIGRHGHIAHLEAVGFSDIESATPMTTDALFRIASMTKVATAIATLRLHEDGKFALDDDASRFVPELQGCRVQAPSTDGSTAANAAGTVPLQGPITIRDLLRHTSGLCRGPAFEALFRDHAVWSEEDGLPRLVQALAQNPLAAQPGAGFRYGLSSDVLGLLLERATGQPLDEILRAHVFEPMKMRDTGFHARPDQATRLTSYYNYEDDRLVRKDSATESPFLKRPKCFSGGGGWPEGHAGLLSTAEDWWRLCEMIRHHGQLDGVRLLREETVKQMVTNQLGSTGVGHIPRRSGLGYGLSVGVVIDRVQANDPGSDGQAFWAGGPYNTYFFIDGAEQLVGILLVQTGPWRHLDLMERFNAMAHRAIDAAAVSDWSGERTRLACRLGSTSSATIVIGDGPDGTAQRFAPGIVSTDHLEHSAPAISLDGGVMFWSIARRPNEGLPKVILFARRAENAWAQPVIAPFSGNFNDDGPAFSPDGRRLYFASNRPLLDGQNRRRISDIWFVERRDGSWSQPQCTGLASRFSAPTSLAMPSVTRGGTVYFVGFTGNGSGGFEIFRARLADADDTLPERLGDSINHPGALNWTPWIAPDESFLLFSSNRPGSHDVGGDIYVVRREPDGSWETPILLDDSVNTPAQERFPAVSPDGRSLFFTRWMREHDHDVFVTETERLAAINPGLNTR